MGIISTKDMRVGTRSFRRTLGTMVLACVSLSVLACSSNNNNSAVNKPATVSSTVVATRAGGGTTVPSATTARPATPGAATSPSAGGVPTFPATSYMAAIQKKGKLTVGTKFDVPLMGLLNPATGKPEGFDVDIAKQLAKAIFGDENKIEFVEAITKNREPFLTEDKVDLVVATYTITDDRKKIIDFSNPYYVAGQSILVRKDYDAIKVPADMNGKKVCAQQGSTSEPNVRAAAPQADLLTLATVSDCAQALGDKRVDAVSTDDIQLTGLSSQNPNFKLVGGVFSKEPYGIGMKQGHPEFVQFVNDQLTAMEKDGRWKTAYDKYIGKYSSVSGDDAVKRVLNP
jgi:glutamate transport system substrate-binding protein